VTQSTQESQQVAAAAHKLRFLQTQLADAPADERAELFADTLRRELQEIRPEKRADFLRALLERFPDWSGPQPAPSAAAAQPATTVETVARVEKEDPQDIIERFFELAESLKEAERQALGERLQAEGFAAGPEPRPAKAPGGQGADDETAELMKHLCALATTLDLFVREAWYAMDPGVVTVERGSPLAGMLQHYRTGEGRRPPVRDMVSRIQELQLMISCLITAMQDVGRCASEHLEKFSPDHIKRMIAAEGRKVWQAKEVAWWQRLEKLYRDANSQKVQAAITQTIARSAEELLKKKAGT